MNRRHGDVSSPGSPRPTRARRLFRPVHEALEGRALMSSDLDPRLLDINKAGVGSNPTSFTEVGATTFLLATDRAHGTELYATDGSAEGTSLVKDINPGPASSNIHGMTALNGLLLFFADDGKHGEELWRSDGTKNGTRLVKDINPERASSAPAIASALNATASFQGKMFFAADDGTHGTELWETNGTAAGTSAVADINAGPASSNPAALTVFNGRLYFQATAGAGGSQLFASDGTSGGTGLVKVLDPAGDASPFDFTPFGGSLFFAANDGTSGTQLWKTDGTAEGTAEVSALSGPFGTDPLVSDLTAADGKLFFATSRGLAVSDGTAGGTTQLGGATVVTNLTAFNGRIFFSGLDRANRFQLFASDGTAAGTVVVKLINPTGSSQPIATTSNPESHFAVLDGAMYFGADDGIDGFQLWRTDGTADGTTKVLDINPAGFGSITLSERNLGSNVNNIVTINGRLFFSANDGPDGSQLWTSLGTAPTTRMLTRIVNGTQASNPIEGFIPGNGFTFFQALDGLHGSELWRTDGTRAGTSLIKDIRPGLHSSAPHDLASFDGRVVFTAFDDQHGREVWISDGTAAGTFMLRDINPGPASSVYGGATPFTEVNGVMYFAADDGQNGVELWRTDGTTSGTLLVKDIDPSKVTFGNFTYAYGSHPSDLTAFNGKLYFKATDRGHGSQLWVSDGTAAGTQRVTDNNPVPGSYASINPQSLTVFNGHLFFGAGDGAGGSALWMSDGTTAGTVPLEEINPTGGSSTFPTALTVVGDKLFFVADDGTHGRELWGTDGTTAGTAMVADLNPMGDAIRSSYYLRPMLADVGGVLLFAAADGTHGQELWRSDGTAAGTSRVADINSGPGDGIKFTDPLDFAVADGKLFFAANDGTHGSRLWMSDGTKKGTSQVSNLSFPYSNPTQAIANVNGSLFFQADDGIHGVELWIIPAEQLAGDGCHNHGDHVRKDSQHGNRDGSPAAGSSATRHSAATQSALTSNALPFALASAPTAPTITVARRQPVLTTALPSGPLGSLGLLHPRVLPRLTDISTGVDPFSDDLHRKG
jgi:ELWxxDGT repeat protein